ncbi:MAG: hypothetical protein Q8K63_04695, partial [Acidimicrobiales bacterium]|nr:hypothetical protein [Acidimicrobiales bacterium]
MTIDDGQPAHEWLRVKSLGTDPSGLRSSDLPARYDLFIGAVGYETRARFVLEWLGASAQSVLGLVFDSHQLFEFQANLDAYQSKGASTPTLDSRVVYKTVQEHLAEAAQVAADGPLRVACDISVLDRTRIAATIMALTDYSEPIDVDFLYAPAAYVPPPTTEPPLVVRNPVHERLTGWTMEPSLPIALIIGLGYEREKAVGAVEFLEPAATVVFVPSGTDDRYGAAVAAANTALWSVHEPDAQIPYDVLDPFGTFTLLESLIFGLKERYRPVVVPFGPKIFSVTSILASLVHAPDVAV